MEEEEGWKARLDIPINYNASGSEDEFEVVTRAQQRRLDSGYLLADSGDGALADMLATTPPRARIRSKEKRRSNMDTDMTLSRMLRANRRFTMDAASFDLDQCAADPSLDRPKKRASLKTQRGRERDMKLDIGQAREHRADSLPSPTCRLPERATPVVTLMVDSCSRFMSLTSRPKVRGEPASPPTERADQPGIPPGRVGFHDTFSMLIRMGNADTRHCRRALSVEEQVWQNQRKDLIWLELRARLAGRTMQQQDELLCRQRDAIPNVINNITNYRFVNTTTCQNRCRATATTSERCHSSDETPPVYRDGPDPLATIAENALKESDDERYQIFGCQSLDCEECSSAVGRALKEVGTLLDSFYRAEALYPSSKAMAAKHPLIATQLFNNRLKAMCLWYNMANHLRLSALGVRKLTRILEWKALSRLRSNRSVVEDSGSKSLQDSQRTPVVQFNLASDSSNSDSSTDTQPAGDECDSPRAATTPTVKLVLDEESPNPKCEAAPQNGTHDTSASTESDHSGGKPCGLRDYLDTCQRYDVYDVGPMSDITKLRLLGNCDVSPYRYYLSDRLKTQSVRKCLAILDKMHQYILIRSYMTFEKYNSSQQSQYRDNEKAEIFEDANEPVEKIRIEDAKAAFELRRYGCWSEETLQMRLPSYRSTFLLLSTICMEVVHDYLMMRLETQPEKPNCLTIKQLMHELKEGLDIATEQRTAFVRNADTALCGYDTSGEARALFVRVVQTFDCTIEKVLTRYLSYLTTMSEVEHMPRATLESEWGFAARLARRTKCAALLAPHIFVNIMVNQLGGVTKRLRDKFGEIGRAEAQIDTGPTDQEGEYAKRLWIYSLCRHAQNIFVCERELAVQSAQFSRVLAAKLKKNSTTGADRRRIYEALMQARDTVVYYINTTTEKTEGTRFEEWEEGVVDVQSVVVRLREVLLAGYKLGFEFHKELHRFVQEPSCRNSSPPQRRPSSINVPSRSRPKLTRSDSVGGDNYVNAVFQDVAQPTTDQSFEGAAVPEMRFEDEHSPVSIASAVCEARCRQEQQQEGKTDSEAKRCEAEWEEQVARAIIDFAKRWMRFVTERCDRGRGLRPRWASKGLEFLMMACDPCNTKHLSEEEFEELKGCMDNCISHVVGSRSPGGVSTPPAPPASATPPPQRRGRSSFTPIHQHLQSHQKVPTPPTPPSEPHPVADFNIDEEYAHSVRAEAAARRLDAARDERLRERRSIGRVLHDAAVSAEPKLRQLTFRWQRGLKIGAGNFGKVYTVVNTDSGQLLAMKEVTIGAGDRRALHKAANELKVLEGVIHPHLVRYYGCEVHREEMLIFMELCVEGSLEALLAESGALPEAGVRRYTKQLVSAILELHNRQIAHRDIKTGNIFLTNERHCLKLGDFGCAVKIRANTTAAGELQGYVGTQAYMAPEVFMKSTGHGRAADIWSLGCVITEMASGKKPFSEYDNNYQIMFVVGMGQRPEIPAGLSDEGRDLCRLCLEHDPELRARAADIVDHHFLKVGTHEDCNCEPGYLITK